MHLWITHTIYILRVGCYFILRYGSHMYINKLKKIGDSAATYAEPPASSRFSNNISKSCWWCPLCMHRGAGTIGPPIGIILYPQQLIT